MSQTWLPSRASTARTSASPFSTLSVFAGGFASPPRSTRALGEDGRPVAAAVFEPPRDAVAAGRVRVGDARRDASPCRPPGSSRRRRRTPSASGGRRPRAPAPVPGICLGLVGRVGDQDRQVGALLAPAVDRGLLVVLAASSRRAASARPRAPSSADVSAAFWRGSSASTSTQRFRNAASSPCFFGQVFGGQLLVVGQLDRGGEVLRGVGEHGG